MRLFGISLVEKDDWNYYGLGNIEPSQIFIRSNKIIRLFKKKKN